MCFARKGSAPMEYETRPVTMDDYDAIYSLWNAAAQSRRVLNPVDDFREGIARYPNRNPDFCFAAVKDSNSSSLILSSFFRTLTVSSSSTAS